MSNSNKFQSEKDSDRSRTWAFEVYPDSADPDWLKYLGESLIHCYVSPLHDKDIDADGNPKRLIIIYCLCMKLYNILTRSLKILWFSVALV